MRDGGAVSDHLVVELLQFRAAAGGDLPIKPSEQVFAPLREIGDPRRSAVRVQREPHDVDRRRQQLGGDAVQQRGHAGVAGHQVPGVVYHQRRVRLVAGQDGVDGGAYVLHLRSVQRSFRVGGRVAGRDQQRVARSYGHLEVLGEAQHHLTAGLGPAGFDEADVPGRGVRGQRQLQLAEPATLAPVAKQRADAQFLPRCYHVRHSTAEPVCKPITSEVIDTVPARH